MEATFDNNLLNDVFKHIDKDELVELAAQLVNIPSSTGNEGEVGLFINNWLKENGIKTFLQEVELERYNVVGVLPGENNGTSIMFNSHMDTSFSGTEEDYLVLGEVTDAGKPNAVVTSDKIYGLGINNDKGPLAAFLVACKAIKQAGVSHSGDIIMAGVVGEIGRASIGNYQGAYTRGKGIGTRYLLSHGVVADYTVVAEPSNYTITWALPGAAFFRLTTRGRAAYTPFTNRAKNMAESENAIVKMCSLVQVIEEWGTQYQENNRYEFSGGEIIPKVNIGAMEGGLPYKPNYSPAICHLYLDVRVPPNRSPIDVKKELYTLFKKHELDVELDMYLSQKGYEGKGVEPIINAMKESHEKVFGVAPEKITPEFTSMWNDLNIYHEMGLPSIKYGTPTIKYGKKREEALEIKDLYALSKAYATVALKITK